MLLHLLIPLHVRRQYFYSTIYVTTVVTSSHFSLNIHDYLEKYSVELMIQLVATSVFGL